MPYARPGARPGLSVSAGSSNSNSSSTGASSVATTWSSEQLDRQLAAIGSVHGGSSFGGESSSLSSLLDSLGDSASGNALSLPSTAATSPSPVSSLPSLQSSSPSTKTPFEQDEQQEDAKMPITAMAAGSSSIISRTSSVPMSSRKAMKAALFQISDSEDGDGDKDDDDAADEAIIDEEEDDRRRNRLQHGRQDASGHGSRHDPVRSSISAMSGVTVIGRGSFSSIGKAATATHNRDDSTSTSSLMSARRSIDEMPEPDPPFAPKSGDGMNLTAALSLLHSYPRSTSPARNKPEDADGEPSSSSQRAKPPLPRSVSTYAGEAAPESFDTIRQPEPVSPTSRRRSVSPSAASFPASSRPRPRRHSRSSIHERGDLFPLAMSPVSASSSLPSTSQPFVSPTFSVSSTNDYITGEPSSPHHHSHATTPPRSSTRRSPSRSISNHIGRPESDTSPRGTRRRASRDEPAAASQTMSRRSSRASEKRADGSSASTSRRPSLASRSMSNADLGQIMRSFSQKPRRTLSRHQVQTADPMDSGPVLGNTTICDEPNTLRRSQRSRNGSQADLKLLIQQKRRQASAPFHSSASIPPSASASPVLGSGAQSPALAVPADDQQPAYKAVWDHMPPRRLRSRHATTAGVNGLAALSTSASGGFEEARLRAMRGMGEVVMTPSVEVRRNSGQT